MKSRFYACIITLRKSGAIHDITKNNTDMPGHALKVLLRKK